MKTTRSLSALVILTVILAACGPTGSDGDGGGDPSSTTTTLTPHTTTTVDNGQPMDVANRAIVILAGRLGVEPADIEVISQEAVTWSDGSLGCPEPGKFYTQALVEGHRMVLGHDERVYVFHSGTGREPFLCESDEKDGGYDFVPPPREG